MNGEQGGFGFVAQQLRIGERTGCDDSNHFSLHRPFASDFAHLFTNRHRFAKLDESRQIVFQRMKRHTRHHHRLPARLPALRERDVEQSRGLLGICEKQLVKIPHAIKHQRIGKVFFQMQVLLHHRRVVREISAHSNRYVEQMQSIYKGASSSAASAAAAAWPAPFNVPA